MITSDANFARTEGAKDKKPRKRRSLATGIVIGSTGTLAGLLALKKGRRIIKGKKLARKVGGLTFEKRLAYLKKRKQIAKPKYKKYNRRNFLYSVNDINKNLLDKKVSKKEKVKKFIKSKLEQGYKRAVPNPMHRKAINLYTRGVYTAGRISERKRLNKLY